MDVLDDSELRTAVEVAVRDRRCAAIVSEDLYDAYPALTRAAPTKAGVAKLLLEMLDLPPVTPLDPVEHACPYVKFYMMGVGAAGMTLHEITSFAGIGIAIVDVSKGRIKFNYTLSSGPGVEMRRAFMLDYYDRLGRQLEAAGLQVERRQAVEATPRPRH